MNSKNTVFHICCICFLLVTLPCTACGKELLFSTHPFANPTAIYQSFQPLISYLQKETGVKIALRVAPNYLAHVNMLGNGDTDIGFVGPSPYVRVMDNYQSVELLARLKMTDDINDKVVIICRKDSLLQTISDLKGKTFAFGDHHSFGSHFMPRWLLNTNGIPLKALNAYDFVRSHDNVVLSVLHGDFSAGGVRQDVFMKYKNRPLRILAGPFSISPHAIVCRASLDEHLKAKIRNSLLQLKKREILDLINPQLEGFEPVQDSDFEDARNIMNFIESR